MKRLEIPNITEQLAPDANHIYDADSDRKHAAVAAILRRTEGHTEALFILRSEKEGDPWSGQMAFPGGHYEQHDDNLRLTAERETFEEIGLDLVANARYIGKIADVHANPRGHSRPMVVSPFIYELENQAASMSPNYEVADILWGSLNDMYNGDSATTHEFDVMGRVEAFPGYSVGEQVVWGLTKRMLENFFQKLNPAWQANT